MGFRRDVDAAGAVAYGSGVDGAGGAGGVRRWRCGSAILLGPVFADEQYVAAFGIRGRPGISPGQLMMVTVLQFVEGLPDRQAAGAVAGRIDWKYCLGLPLDHPGFDFSVLSEFRARLVEHDLTRAGFDAVLERCCKLGLVKAGGKQRTDATHVISAVRDMSRLELAGESVRALTEALAQVAPDWLADAVDVHDWAGRPGSNKLKA
jgi:transposase